MSVPQTRPAFVVGQEYDIGGVRLRIRQGRKGPDDLVLDIEGYAGYVPVRMTLGALMADFFFQNEERLYPQEFNFEGGNRYVRFIHRAIAIGWENAAAQLARERALREVRNDHERPQ